MSLQRNPAKAFLVDIETGRHLEFRFNPSELNEEKSTSYAQQKVPGRSHPRYHFVTGDARKLSFKIDLYGDNVVSEISFLNSLLYPSVRSGSAKTCPHAVQLLGYGDMYVDVMWRVMSIKDKLTQFDSATLTPTRAEVEISLEQFVERSIAASEVAR